MKRLLFLLLVLSFSMNAQFKNSALKTKFDRSIINKIQVVYDDKNISKISNNAIKQNHSNKEIPIDDNIRLLVRLNVKSKKIKDQLINLGCNIKNEGWDELYVWVPVDKFEALAEYDDIKSIVLIPRLKTQTQIFGEGYYVHRANYATDFFSLNGNGVKVGVISDGMNYYQNSQNQGELPANVWAVDNSNNASLYPGSEGTAMMEIVHDFAPSAELWFGGIGENGTPIDFANRVAHLSDAGCKIIVDDIGFLSGYSFFEEREISSAINQFIQTKNGSYISSVGNNNGTLFSSNSYVVDNSKKIKFNNNNLTFQTPSGFSGSISVFFQWADSWANPTNDFDIEIWNSTDNILVGSGTNRGSSFNPEEVVSFTGAASKTYSVIITWVNYIAGSVSPEIKIIVNGIYSPNFNPSCTTKQIYGHKMTNNVIGVAATSSSIPTVIESFSSRGPAVEYSPSSGAYTTVQQPKITAADNIWTYVGSVGNFPGGYPFYGTSAAAPQVAGIAALYFQKYPSHSFSNFLNRITGSSVAMSDGGSSNAPNYISGYGRIDALNLFMNSLTQVTSQTYSANATLIETRLNGTNTINDNVQITIPANTVSSINNTVNFGGSNAKFIVQGTLILEQNSTLNFFNIEKSGSGRVMDLSGKYVQVNIEQLNSTAQRVGVVQYWQFSKWNNVILGTPSTYPIGNLVLKGDQTVISNEKYQNWQSSLTDVTNFQTIPLDKSSSRYVSYFKPVNNATIKNTLEGSTSISGGTVGFQDPWLIDYTETKGSRNRGTMSTALMYDNLASPFTPNINTNYKGVFLNTPPIVNGVSQASYKVRVPQNQNIYLASTSKTHKFYFLNWSATNGAIVLANNLVNGFFETPIIFTGPDAIIQSNLKGTQLSNNSGTISNNSQRKITRDYSGRLHVVYESMGRIWYERSTDGGTTWEIMNNGHPLDSGEGKLPTIDAYSNQLAVVWQEKYGDTYSDIKIAYIDPGTGLVQQSSALTPVGPLLERPLYSTNANPAIAYGYESKYMAVWENKTANYPGLVFSHGIISSGAITKLQTASITNTSSASVTPSISVNKEVPSLGAKHFCIAWGENNQIKFQKYNQNLSPTNTVTAVGTAYTISNGCSYPVNIKPSVFALSDTSARVAWNGVYNDGADNFSVTVFKSTDYTQFWNFGDNVNSVSVNGSPTSYAVVWAKNNNTIEYTPNTSLQVITTLSGSDFAGKDIQVSGGVNRTDFRALTLNAPAGGPNFFQTKQIFATNKENAVSVFSGRGGCVYTDDNQYYFSFGDISVNGQKVNFTELPEKTVINNVNVLNKYLITEPFNIDDNSKLTYSAVYGVIDSALAVKSMKAGELVNFKVELIDEKTGNILSAFDNLLLSNKSIVNRGSKSYSISAKGTGSKTVRLRLTTNANIKAEYAISNIYSTNPALKKSSVETIELKNALEVKEYALEQNYPNPFNPSTVIRYQIPSANKVTLKVYDVLGKEIAVLVDEFREAGRYQVTFDCGKLASGVYMYKLEAGNYSQSRKMILTK